MGGLVVVLDDDGVWFDRAQPPPPEATYVVLETCLHERAAAEEEGPGGLLALGVGHRLLDELRRGQPRGAEGAHESGERREARDCFLGWGGGGSGSD